MWEADDNLSRGVERHRNMRFRQTAADVSISQPQSLREPFDHYNSACPEFSSNRLQEIYGTRTASQAAQALDQTSPALSAKRGLSEAQKFVFAGLFCGLTLGLAWQPSVTLTGLIVLALIFFTAMGLLRALILVKCYRDAAATSRPPLPNPISSKHLPTYTILVPLLNEAEVLPGLIKCLKQIHYPKQKLDIKLIFEQDDHETFAVAQRMDLDEQFELVRVPACYPKTKPKACNYALKFARGEFLVIYDAEDRPEPAQLYLAVQAFRQAPSDLICLQARLNFYNAHENWLTRQFTIEYAIWFYVILPGLHALGLPIPLGGTSNHFRTRALRLIGAWDPYNVTEDADLGIRLAALGYRCGILDSTTYEEANCRPGNWLRQRSRWQKGFLQTWLVHMRQPAQLHRALGIRGFWAVQLIIAGSVATGLAPALFAAGVAFWAAGFVSPADTMMSFPLALVNVSVLVASLTLSACLGIVGLRAAGQAHHVRSIVWMPIYWCLITMGTLKGLWQFFTKRHYWEKTKHGLSQYRA